jgi:hypothetical protein
VTNELFIIHPDGSVASDRLLLTVAETARALGYSFGSLRNMLRENPNDPLGCGLRPVRVGKSNRFVVWDVIRVVAGTDQGQPAAGKPNSPPRASGKARVAKKEGSK